MSNRTVTAQCCAICGRPMRVTDSATVTRDLERVEGLVVTFGASRGGWGRRDIFLAGAVALQFSEEICGTCFDHVQALMKPLAEFLRRTAPADNQPAKLQIAAPD